jgi:endonuclease-8
MPEGDTIFRAAARLSDAFAGTVITKFKTGFAHLQRVDDESPIAGRSVERIHAIGKHLLVDFSGGLTLSTHMRMNGSWHLYRQGERWQRRFDVRIILENATFVAAAFSIPVAEFVATESIESHRELARLGPDLLSEGFDEERAFENLRRLGETIMADALLDQRVMAGAGNVFKSEVLFLTGVHPLTTVAEVAEEKLREIIAISRELLRENVADLRQPRRVAFFGQRRTTRRLHPAERTWVYGRRGEACRKCGTGIEYAKLGFGARPTYWCPRCQALPAR